MADSEYLRRTVGEPLTRCLADVVLHRPHDPIEYIASWLYKHASNVQHELQRAKEAEQLAKEIEQQKETEELMIQLLLEEEELCQRKNVQAAKELEEANRLQAHHTDNSVAKHGLVPAIQSVPSIQYAFTPEEDDEEEEDGAESHEPSQTSQHVALESEVL